MVDDAISIEEDLVASVLAWIQRDWPIDRILVPLREANTRGIQIVQNLGLASLDSVKDEALADHRCFISGKKAAGVEAMKFREKEEADD